MKKRIIIYLLITTMLIISAFSGCSLLKKVPEKYTEGVKYDRDYPDDALEIYDDSIVFESRSEFDDIILSCGSEDDLDDIIDFYRDFFEDNDIVLIEEDEDRDEYFAHGTNEGYEFKLMVEEADGEYIQDLFEYVILLSVSEISNPNLKADEKQQETTATPQTTLEPTATNKPTTAPTSTPVAQNNGETPLVDLHMGSWTAVAIYENSELKNIDCTIEIYADGTGTLYYADFYEDERWFTYFNYDIKDGSFFMTLDNGDIISYFAYLDDGILHLEYEDGDADMYLTNWNESVGVYPSNDVFTAYGDWIYYEPETGYIETIAFWPDESGLIYNWGGSYEDYAMNWEYNDGIFAIYDEIGNQYAYGIMHKGEVFELHQENGSVFFYNRISGNYWLNGTFYMEETSEDELSEFFISFYADGTCDVSVNNENGDGYNDTTDWYIDPIDGTIHIKIGDRYTGFYYHYNVYGLVLWDYTSELYYRMVSVG